MAPLLFPQLAWVILPPMAKGVEGLMVIDAVDLQPEAV
jgi:hypothetical protein